MRHDVRVADKVLSSARGRGDPPADAPVAAQPFTHLGVPNAEQYRRLLQIFARAKERFIVHLRPEDIAAELRVDADDQLTEALDRLVTWGNLRSDVDTGRVTTVEDFHRKRSLYQLTGDPASTPWDPDLATAMAHHDVRVEEELFLDTLLADLA